MNFLKKNILRLSVLIFALSACTDNFEELNSDPNQPTDVPAENLLTQAQFDLADRYWSRAMNFELGMLFVQHFAQNEYGEESRYQQTPSSFNAVWNDFFAGGLSDLNEAVNIVEASDDADAVKANKIAVLTITRVWAYQAVTDTWGNVPYSEAFNPDEFANPAYDDQSAIYEGLLTELNGAIDNINPSAGGFGSGDIIYGGDLTLWTKFANSLKLRLGMRMVDANPGLASTAISEAAAADLITANDENAIFVFGSDQRIANPFYVDQLTRDDFCVASPLVEAMKATSDPRLSLYAKPNTSGVIQGMPYGLTDGAAFSLKSVSSRPTDAIRLPTAPAYLLTSAEVHFFLAEAVERDIIGGDAEELFNDAVADNMSLWGVADADISSYLANNPYNSADWEASIGYEKWVALYSNGMEAWAEHRRLDQPVLEVPNNDAVALDQIPVRALYPAVEDGNNSSYSEIESNNMTTNVWWDVD